MSPIYIPDVVASHNGEHRATHNTYLVIATDWGGPSEYMDPEYAYPLGYNLVDAGGVESNHSTYDGRWAEPDYEHLRYLMRWLYEHPEAVASVASTAGCMRA